MAPIQLNRPNTSTNWRTTSLPATAMGEAPGAREIGAQNRIHTPPAPKHSQNGCPCKRQKSPSSSTALEAIWNKAGENLAGGEAAPRVFGITA